MPELVELDLDTLTLGELAAAEKASGEDGTTLLSRSAHRRILVVFVQRLRSSGTPPSWSELAGLRVSEVSSSRLDSSPASRGVKSSD
jgi:hypothetical protein